MTESTSIDIRLTRAAVDKYLTLDAANSDVVARVVAHSGPSVIRGCPGSGRTSVALNIAKQIYQQDLGNVWILVPDRLRADQLQAAGEYALPGVVRPVRTPIALAFHFTSRWYVERKNPLPAPQLKTGAREDSDLALAIEAGVVQWPAGLTPETLAMPEFRMEVRNLMARAREAGWSGNKLAEIGAQLGRDLWVSTGELMELWAEQALQSTSSESPALYDAAALQELAADVISSWDLMKADEGVLADLDAPRAVIVDDLQDCTGATLSLLEALHNVGTRIIATADPDVAVATYRGGEPHLDGRLIELLGAVTEDLGPTHRGNQTLRGIVQKVTQQVTVRDSAKRRAVGSVDPSTDPSAITVEVYGSHSQEANAIARQIRRYELGYGRAAKGPVPLSRQAVIVRSAADVNRIRFGLQRNGIATTVRRRALTYRSDPVTSILLQVLYPPILDRAETDTIYDRVLRSPLINARMTDVRRISDFYRAHVSDEPTTLFALTRNLMDGAEGSAEVLEKIFMYGYGQTYADLVKAFKLVEAGTRAGTESPQAALWKLWKVADVEREWAEEAMQPGVESEVYDERLDAIVSLFRTADVWEQRYPGVKADFFAVSLLEELLPTDTLADTGQRPAGVNVLTVAQAVGQDWDVVYIASVQDGRWPNLTLRDRLTRAGEVAELANGNATIESLALTGATTRAMRKRALVEEYRLLAAAVSRASTALHVSAVQSDEEAPSFVLNNLAKWAEIPMVEGTHLPVTKVAPGVDTRSLIARLRQVLAQTSDPEMQKWYSTLLAVLANEGVALANPQVWNAAGGLTPSGEGIEGLVTLSPSQIETLVKCPAQWFLTKHGGDRPFTTNTSVGNLIHRIAEEMPHADLEQMLQRLEELWDNDTFSRDTAYGEQLYADATDKLTKLASYLVHWRDREVQIEQPVFQEVEIDGERLNIAGRLDRIEHTDDGVIITDIKTGKVPSQYMTVEHLQLAAYQYALHAQNIPIVKARLLALKQSLPTNWVQPNLFSEDDIVTIGKNIYNVKEIRERLGKVIAQAARTARSDTFPAQTGAHCAYCPVMSICPVYTSGLRTIE